jgi:legumain
VRPPSNRLSGASPPLTPHPAQIITFLFNDVAGDVENLFPGQLFNAPTPDGVAGEDVYPGCVTPGVTYIGENVTVANFLAVLTGNASAATGPVLRSDASSKVFVNLVDHGGAGLFAFPSEILYADQLHDAMTAMTTAKMFSELVFYLEVRLQAAPARSPPRANERTGTHVSFARDILTLPAPPTNATTCLLQSCESGSMFEFILPNTTGMYAATASSPDESSWGTYCPGDPDHPGASSVNGTDLQTCLGDLFSVSWMEAVFLNCSAGDGAHRCTESLLINFNLTSAWTNLSTPHQYGDLRFQASPVGGWVSNGRAPFPPAPATRRHRAPPPRLGAVSARDAAARSLRARLAAAAAAGAALRAAALAQQLAAVGALERKQGAAFRALARALGAASASAVAFPAPFSAWECYRAANLHVAYTDASWAMAKVVAAACAKDPAGAPAALAAACAAAGGCK